MVRPRIRTAQQGSIRTSWHPLIHIFFPELARCRSDLFNASSISHLARKETSWWTDRLRYRRYHPSRGNADMVGVISLVSSHDKPKESARSCWRAPLPPSASRSVRAVAAPTARWDHRCTCQPTRPTWHPVSAGFASSCCPGWSCRRWNSVSVPTPARHRTGHRF